MNVKKSLWLVASALILSGCSSLSKIASTNVDALPSKVPTQPEEVSEEVLKGWPHTNLAKDGFPGINLQGAYDLLKGLKPTTVVVGVIDSGIDINHEDLKNVLWVNPNEIANNGIDDDNNGYVDDVYGWNFLGDVNHENLEYVRIMKTNDTKNPDFAKAKTMYETEHAQALENKTRYEQLMQMIETADVAVQKALKKKDYTLKDLENFQTQDDNLQQYVAFLARMVSLVGSVNQAKEDLSQGVKHFTSKLNYHLNLNYHPRKEILKDDENDFSKVGYGNNNVIGPDVEESLHGTHVAGIIAAQRGNSVGMDGVASNVKIMTLRAVPDGDEYDKDIAFAIRYAADNGAKVVNTSFGKDFSPHYKQVQEAIKYAASKDVLIVNAAGNDSKNIDNEEVFPTDEVSKKEIADNFLTVGALNYKYDENLVASFSNFGKRTVDVFAPGVKIWATAPENTYKFLQGTSMASPEVAGLAALIRSYFPKLTAAEVKKVIMQSGMAPKFDVIVGEEQVKVNFSELSTSGTIVNARNAVILAAKMSRSKK
ncbi:S8 family peptidase [Capnocytophaga canimorsus]|uniref:S8 family peptidase n=1 Tax=Capnocytophaga canimorsus TaxID=28188 RepID=UPI0037D30528